MFYKTFFVAASLAMTMTTSAALGQDNVYVVDSSEGKDCWVEAYTNSSATWTMIVSDGDDPIAEFQGTGTDFVSMPAVKGPAKFVAKLGISVTFQSSTGKADIKAVGNIIPTDNNGPAVFGTAFGGEDGSDDDWQDVLAVFMCLNKAG